MRDFRELQVWQKSHSLTIAVYRVTKNFPREELYGLTSQIRRAVVSISANIAEGCCRRGKADFAHFLQISLASASELEYLLLLCYDIELLKKSDYEQLANAVIEVKRMLTTFTQKLRTDD